MLITTTTKIARESGWGKTLLSALGKNEYDDAPISYQDIVEAMSRDDIYGGFDGVLRIATSDTNPENRRRLILFMIEIAEMALPVVPQVPEMSEVIEAAKRVIAGEMSQSEFQEIHCRAYDRRDDFPAKYYTPERKILNAISCIVYATFCVVPNFNQSYASYAFYRLIDSLAPAEYAYHDTSEDINNCVNVLKEKFIHVYSS